MPMRRILLLFLLIVFGGCQNQSDDSYITLPEFISSVFVMDNDSGQHICVVIDQSKVWETGNNGEELTNQIVNTIILELGSQNISDNLHIEIRDTAQDFFDDDGTYIGSSGGEITMCFEIENLRSAIYQVHLEFRDLQETVYSFIWSFEVLNHGTTHSIILYIKK